MKKVLFLAFIILPALSFGQDLVYRPINPAFGGNYLNHSWMLNSAQLQKTEAAQEAEQSAGRSELSRLNSFQENLNRQILSQLASRIIQSQFGEQSLQPGSYVVGTFEINIIEGTDGLNVTIFDASTGNETSIVIPNL